MSETKNTVRVTAGRPRDSAVDRKIVEAAIEQYAEKGWGRFSFDTVASRSGVGKPAIYLRYASREELLIGALETLMYPDVDSNNGTLRADLREMILALFAFRLSALGTAVHRITADQFYNPELAELYRHRIVGPRIKTARRVVERAKQRGEIHKDVDTNLLLEAISGAVAVRVTDTHLSSRHRLKAIVEEYAEQLLDIVLNGARRPQSDRLS